MSLTLVSDDIGDLIVGNSLSSLNKKDTNSEQDGHALCDFVWREFKLQPK